MSLPARTQPRYRCVACAYVSDRWSARCPSCDGWIASGDSSVTSLKKPASAPASTPETPRRPIPDHEPAPDLAKATPSRGRQIAVSASDLVPITDIQMTEETRFTTKIEPLDRVLGGGLMPGGSFLISGGPGAGKSTLLSQMLYLACRPDGSPCERLMWATAEEAVSHVAIRAHRIGTAHPKIRVIREADVDKILAHAAQFSSEILVVDSIQTLTTEDIKSTAGSVEQVKECAIRLDNFAKTTLTCAVLICQETKDGKAAGPNTLKHLVDVLLSLEKDEMSQFRYLTSDKNRHGSTLESGCFEMGNQGLLPVDLPPPREDQEARQDELLPVAQELLHLLLEAGGSLDAGLRERIAGRLDLTPRGSR